MSAATLPFMSRDTDAKPADPPASPPGHLTGAELAVAAVLAGMSFLLYIPSLSNGFVRYDDPHYVTGNPVVQRGLTPEGLHWAFTTTTFANWLPVTWLSHMLDCHLFGISAGGHHATSAALHAFNAAALFLALRAMTARFWAPAAAAALFAFHPLRVESVSWVAERKDVLCGTFFMLALLAYGQYCRRPTAGRYLALLACHALGLMSKTMLVTLPCLLLLLDYWPLRRMRLRGHDPSVDDSPVPPFPTRPFGGLVLEKLPLLALSVAASAWTSLLQSTGGAMRDYADLTLDQRLANAVVSVPRYLARIAWPADLSVFYPHPGSWPAWKVAGASVLVLALSVAAASQFRRRPHLFVGWFWFLGMLVPVSGIIQVGLQSMADRYTYLPAIGLAVAVVWWVTDALVSRPRLAPAAVFVTVLALASMSVASWRQQRHWVDTMALFRHAYAVDPDNWLANNTLGSLYTDLGEEAQRRGDAAAARRLFDLAQYHLYRSVELNPRHYLTFHNYAWCLYCLGRFDEAAENFRRSMRLYPEFGMSEHLLALTLARLGRTDEALGHFEQAARRLPESAEVRNHWGEALLQAGRRGEAAERFKDALRVDPNYEPAKYWLGQLRSSATSPATSPSSAPATPPAQIPPAR